MNSTLKEPQFLITCEHATNLIPEAESKWLKIPKSVLTSHRAWDLGASEVAKEMRKILNAELILGTHTRLMCDLNRSDDHKNVFSEFSRSLDPSEKKRLLKIYHRPHWNTVKTFVKKKSKRKALIIHLGIHSFTPIYDDYQRPTELGILYDPSRALEKNVAKLWQKKLKNNTTRRIDLNLPYRGTGNGLISSLRQEWPEQTYLGFEIELNQSALETSRKRQDWAKTLAQTLKFTLHGHFSG